MRDYVTFGLQIADSSIGRVPNGAGAWQLTSPTPGAVNAATASATVSDLRINEWMAQPDSGEDWFEIHNLAALPAALGGLYLTDTLSDPTKTRLAALSFIAPGGFTQFLADEHPEKGADHVHFKLSANGESIRLSSTNGARSLDTITFGAQSTGVSQGRLPDGSSNIVFFPTTASPDESNHLPLSSIVFNEVLTHTDSPLEDAIELYNPTGAPVELGGWFLSDDKQALKKFRIPEGTTVSAGGFRVFYEYQFNADTNSPTSFSLSSAHGDDVYLSVADAAGHLTGYRTHEKFGPVPNGVSPGRFATSAGVDFTGLNQRTFGVDHPTTLAQFRAGGGLPNS